MGNHPTEGTGGEGWADAAAKALERAVAKARRAAYERRQSKRFRVPRYIKSWRHGPKRGGWDCAK